MFLYEYQAKEILRKNGFLIPKNFLVSDADEIKEAINNLEKRRYMIKAQILSGDRMQNGGIFSGSSKKEIFELADKMLGTKIITKQNNFIGEEVRSVLIEEEIKIKEKIFLSFVFDRESEMIRLLLSSFHVENIEEVALHNASKIINTLVDRIDGLKDEKTLTLLKSFCDEKSFLVFVLKIYELFIATDLLLLELNPLVFSTKGELICLDAKFNVDDNSLFRQQHTSVIEETWKENFVELEGNIGCIVNGAGLAMATMDMIQTFGGVPANFLDIGRFSRAQLLKSIRYIFENIKVEIIVVNIFGGVVNCEIVANAIVDSVQFLRKNTQIIIRFKGNSAENAYQILKEKKVTFIKEDDFEKIIREAIRMAKK